MCKKMLPGQDSDLKTKMPIIRHEVWHSSKNRGHNVPGTRRCALSTRPFSTWRTSSPKFRQARLLFAFAVITLVVSRE